MNGKQGVNECGIFIIDDRYFLDFPSDRHMDNKNGSRPYYFAVQGKDDIFWMVPISHQVEKYKRKIKANEDRYGESIFCFIANLKGEERAFLTGNVIPVTKDYIRPFTVKGIPLVIKNQKDTQKIRSKVSKYLALTRQGKMRPAVDILSIEKKLKEKKSSK